MVSSEGIALGLFCLLPSYESADAKKALARPQFLWPTPIPLRDGNGNLDHPSA
jgi:hypothetical protein